MKNQFLFAFFVALFFVGCEKDDGFRAVTVEIELGAVPENLPNVPFTFFVQADVLLASDNPDTELEFFVENNGGDPKKIVRSGEVLWAVGSNIRRYVTVMGDDGNYNLPSDVTVRIKADNKVIWSYNGKKGEIGLDESNINLVIR